MSNLNKARIHALDNNGDILEGVDVCTSGEAVTMNNDRTLEDIYTNDIGTSSTLVTNSKKIVGAINENTEQLLENEQYIKTIKSNVKYKSVACHISDFGLFTTDSELTHIFNQGVSVELCNMVKILSLTDSSPIGMNLTNLQNEINRIKNANIPISMIKPHLGVNASDSTYRPGYDPSDKALFFSNWKTLLLNYASICNTNNIPILCLSCEMTILTNNTYISYWEDIYNSIKILYPNLQLLHAPTTGEFYSSSNYNTWKYTDILGTNFYPSYGSKEFTDISRISESDLNQIITMMATRLRYHRVVRNLYPDKPIFFTEIGLMPYTDTLIECISNKYLNGVGIQNYWVQEALGRAIFQYLCKDTQVIGFCWWSVKEPFNYFDDIETRPLEQLFINYVKGGLI